MDLALTFDDVTLVPQYNNIDSRNEPSLETWFSKQTKIDYPFIPSNMDTVISRELAFKIQEKGGVWIAHRFHKKRLFEALEDYPDKYGVSVGVKDINLQELDMLSEYLSVICIDVAHAHGVAACKAVELIKKEWGEAIDVVAGNVCTARGYRDLVNAGADVVKVGVGCGAACTTRMVTGFGIPQFSAIRECAVEAVRLRVPIVADGGIRTSRDIVLALAAGASTVMMGKVFASTEESAAKKEMRIAEPWNGDGIPVERRMARYRGQASFDFQQEFYGEVKHAPEGEAFWIPVQGTFEEVMKPFEKALKAGMTYGGARTIKELQQKAEFRQVTHTFMAESGTRP